MTQPLIAFFSFFFFSLVFFNMCFSILSRFFFSFFHLSTKEPILLSSFEETVYSPVLFKFLFINIFLHTMTASWVLNLTQLGLNSEGGGRGRGVPEKQK